MTFMVSSNSLTNKSSANHGAERACSLQRLQRLAAACLRDKSVSAVAAGREDDPAAAAAAAVAL